jgi:hypothetical protein
MYALGLSAEFPKRTLINYVTRFSNFSDPPPLVTKKLYKFLSFGKVFN